MTDSEVPKNADETAMECAVQPTLPFETQHALRVLLVKLADRCLGHAHAKEQSDEPPSSEPAKFSRITAFGNRHTALFPHETHPHTCFVITRALEEAGTSLRGMLADKPFVVALLLQWFAASPPPPTHSQFHTPCMPRQRGGASG